LTWAFLVFYRLCEMSKEDAEKARKSWEKFKKTWPSGIRLVGEYTHAWGTEYNGLFLIESDSSDEFLNWWPTFKDQVRWYVSETKTVIAQKRV